MPEPSRARRFSLPDLADERVDESIRSFLSGPKHRRGRREPAVAPSVGGYSFVTLETRMAWVEALSRETARSARYMRPAAVMVIAGEANTDSLDARAWLARVAGPIAHTVQRGIRETDLVTRTGDARFQILLPETTGPEAAHVAERMIADCDVWLKAARAPVTVRASSAGTSSDSTLEAALDRALSAMDAPRSD